MMSSPVFKTKGKRRHCLYSYTPCGIALLPFQDVGGVFLQLLQYHITNLSGGTEGNTGQEDLEELQSHLQLESMA